MIRAIARALRVSSEFEQETESAATPIEKFQRLLDGRTPEEQDQAVRVIKGPLQVLNTTPPAPSMVDCGPL